MLVLPAREVMVASVRRPGVATVPARPGLPTPAVRVDLLCGVDQLVDARAAVADRAATAKVLTDMTGRWTRRRPRTP